MCITIAGWLCIGSGILGDTKIRFLIRAKSRIEFQRKSDFNKVANNKK